MGSQSASEAFRSTKFPKASMRSSSIVGCGYSHSSGGFGSSKTAGSQGVSDVNNTVGYESMSTCVGFDISSTTRPPLIENGMVYPSGVDAHKVPPICLGRSSTLILNDLHWFTEWIVRPLPL